MKSNIDGKLDYGVMHQGLMPTPWQVYPALAAMQQMQMPLGMQMHSLPGPGMTLPAGLDGYPVPASPDASSMMHPAYGNGWMPQIQMPMSNVEQKVGDAQCFQPPLLAETSTEMRPHSIEPDNWAVPTPSAGQPMQHKKRQRQAKAKPRSHVRTPADDSDQEPEDAEAVTATQQIQAESVLKELRSGSVPRAQLAVAEFVRMSFHSNDSSRAAQIALEMASATEQVTLATGLRGQVRQAMQSKNANYVITKAVEVMPALRVSFVAEELVTHGRVVARHRFGCRVLCRILEHLSQTDTNSLKLLDEVLDNAGGLCNHAFGSIVIRHFLEHGLDEHRRRIADALSADPSKAFECAMQRKGSHVVEAALRSCSPNDTLLLAEQLLANSDEVVALATSQFGRHVVSTLLDMEGDKAAIKQLTIQALLPFANVLLVKKYAKSLCTKLQHLGFIGDATASSPADSESESRICA